MNYHPIIDRLKRIAELLPTAIGGGGITPTGTKTINVTQNGTVTEDVTNYANAEVITNVPQGVFPSGTKTINITQNGTVTEDVTNYANAEVITNVPQGVFPSGTKTINITQNGTVTEDVTNYANAEVITNVPIENCKIFTFSSPAAVAQQTVKIVDGDPIVASHYSDPNVLITCRKMSNNNTNGLSLIVNSNHNFGNSYGNYSNFNGTANNAAIIASDAHTAVTSGISIWATSDGDIFVRCASTSNNFGGADYIITFSW